MYCSKASGGVSQAEGSSLKLLETRNAPAERQRWKVRLVKGLYERGLSAEQVRQLFRLLDWMIQLPKELEQQFQMEKINGFATRVFSRSDVPFGGRAA